MSLPSLLLRLEAFALLLASLFVWHHLAQPWWLFFAAFLVPDLSMIGYALGTRAGALCYNAVHTLVLPAVFLALALVLSAGPRTLALVVVWFAHIGLDRALGFGLKYPSSFGDTHLHRV